MEMISALAPLLRHMPPGHIRGHGSHEWMMTALPAALHQDWVCGADGGVIKYPFAVEISVELASSLKPDYPAEQLVDILLEKVVRAAASAALGVEDGQRCRAQMQTLGAQCVALFSWV